MKHHLITKKRSYLAMTVFAVIACLNACSLEETETFEEQSVEKEIFSENFLEKDLEKLSESETTENVPEEMSEEYIEEKITETLAEFEEYLNEISAEAEEKHVIEKSYYDRERAEQAFEKVNEQRRLAGVEELVWDESLYELACIRAQEIVNTFSHERPDGSEVSDIILNQQGASGCGENIASNYKSITNLINGWLNSQGHKENMMDQRFDSGVMACYYSNGNYHWVNLFKQS